MVEVLLKRLCKKKNTKIFIIKRNYYTNIMKEYKRIEIPLWWKCNENCFFCSETEFINFHNWKSLNFKDFYDLLIKYYKQWYNHLTIVWWEPTIEDNFSKAIKLAKKLWMWTQISTNWLKFADENFTKNAMQYLDRITLSIHTIDNDKFKKITQTNIHNRDNLLSKIISNIKKYQNWQSIRINCVLNKYNLNSNKILNIINFIENSWLKYESIALTYPDITVIEDTRIKKYIFIYPDEIKKTLLQLWKKISKEQKKKIVLADMPFCFTPKSFYKNCQDVFFDNKSISKIFFKDKVKKQDRDKIDPRSRFKVKKCYNCKMEKKCFWMPNMFKDNYDSFFSIKY